MKNNYIFYAMLCSALTAGSINCDAQEACPLNGVAGTNEMQRANAQNALDSLINIATEVVPERTLYSACYKTKSGTMLIKSSSQPINYVDAKGELQPIKIELESDSHGWIAKNQPNPCYFNSDRSTGISIGAGRQLVFNQNSMVNGVAYDEQLTALSKNIVTLKLSNSIQKNITFRINGIETDYVIYNSPGNTLEISEDVDYPSGCSLVTENERGTAVKGNWRGNYILLSETGAILAKFNAPVCYDAVGKICVGYYNLTTKNGIHILKTIVPEDWLKNATYPVTVDPFVVGPTSTWSGKSMPTCFLPNYYKSDSLQITVPGGINITKLYVSTSIQSNLAIFPYVYASHGRIVMATKCGNSVSLACAANAYPVYCNLVLGSFDFHQPLTCCLKPTCTSQTFYLHQELARDTLGPSCDTDYVYYSGNPTVFEAFVEGSTDSVLASTYVVTPAQICSNTCQLSMKVTAEYGVLPYVLKHPWLAVNDTFGTNNGCANYGSTTVKLKIPGCPTYCKNGDTLSVPPPVITDACGNVVTGTLATKKIILKGAPEFSATPDSITVCSGTPISFNLKSCVPGIPINWTGSNNTSGTDSVINAVINDTSRLPLKITYSATGTNNGCNGDTVKMKATIVPIPTFVITPSSPDTIQIGSSVNISAAGIASCVWTPSTGLSCTTCPNPVATPTVTTTYYLYAQDANGCSNKDSIRIVVIQPGISVPNVFTPNGDGKNDFFFIKGLQYYPNSSLSVLDRWGVLVYQSNNYQNDWDGSKQSDGTYYYTLTTTEGKKYKGFVQILR